MMRILFYVGSGLVGGALMFQMPAKPPMKMGLWEHNSTSTITDMKMPKGMTTLHTSIRSHMCVTPESYAKSFADPNISDCVRSNESWNGSAYTCDLSCKLMTGHFDMHFDSAEAGHATMHLTKRPKFTGVLVIDFKIDMHFVSSDCGSVTPEHPEILH
jgi:hypothetical protein